MRRLLKWIAGCVAIIVLALGLFVAFNAELRNFLLYSVAPERARNANFIQMTVPAREGPSLFLLGTIHGRHLNTESFSLTHLEAVIRHLEPDLLLVESRPEEIAAGHWGDGPIEMPFASLTARALGISVDGIDWWVPRTDGRRTDANRDDQIFRRLEERLPNSGVVLILIGYSHIPELVDRLSSRGFVDVHLANEEKQRLFDTSELTLLFPEGMTEAIEERIRLEEANVAETEDGEWRQTLNAVISSRQELLSVIRQVGEHQGPQI